MPTWRKTSTQTQTNSSNVEKYVPVCREQNGRSRVGEAPGEYPSVCTGPYYRVPKKKKKKKKKKNAISFI